MIPIKRLKHGPFSYRATFDVPKLAADGVLTHIDGRIGRRYASRAANAATSSPAARPAILRTHGHFLFADGTIIDGTRRKALHAHPLVP